MRTKCFTDCFFANQKFNFQSGERNSAVGGNSVPKERFANKQEEEEEEERGTQCTIGRHHICNDYVSWIVWF